MSRAPPVTSDSPPYRTGPSRLLRRGILRLIRAADRVVGAWMRRNKRTCARPVSAELSRRSLWGHVPRPSAPHPEGPPLLALSFDLDYQEDTDALPALLRLAERVDAEMTLFSIGKLVDGDPGPYREVVAAGHEIGNHTWSHPDNPVLNPDQEFWDLSVEAMTKEIRRAQDIFDRELGVRPTGFRTPHFKDAPRMVEALGAVPEINYMSTALGSKTPLAVPYFPTERRFAGDQSLHYSSVDETENRDELMIPLTPCPEHRWTPFCSYHGIRQLADPDTGAGMHGLAEWEDLWATMLDQCRPNGFASVYFDPMDVMRDDETTAAFERMLTTARNGGWRLTTCAEVADHWRSFLKGATEEKTVTA